jgi:hypothetical protein
MKSRFALILLLLSLAAPVIGHAQQPDEAAAAGQNGEPDLAAEVHQLKTEIDRLSRELERVSAELERLQNDHAAEQVVSAVSNQETALPSAPVPTVTPKPAPAPPTSKTTRGKAAAKPSNVSPQALAEAEDKTPTTMLVFQDGRHLEARNYAIVGQTVWVYTEQDSKRFSLADLNVEETRRANAERGVAFQVPPSAR